MVRFINTISYIFFAVILFTAVNNCFSQSKSNLEIFDKQISRELDEIFYKPDIRRDIQFIFKIRSLNNNQEEVRFLTSVIKKAAERNKMRVNFSNEMASSDSVFNSFWIDIIELKTKYNGFGRNKFLGDKTVKRNLSGKIKIEAAGGNYFYQDKDTININYNDEVDYKEIENIETAEYRFTHDKQPKVSIYEEIVFPIAIVTVSVVAAILFFSIRSK